MPINHIDCLWYKWHRLDSFAQNDHGHVHGGFEYTNKLRIYLLKIELKQRNSGVTQKEDVQIDLYMTHIMQRVCMAQDTMANLGKKFDTILIRISYKIIIKDLFPQHF